MTSDRQIRANRANAARSTGPRSRAGKLVARLNAQRHGLAVLPNIISAEAEEAGAILQREIVGEYEAPDLIDAARAIAQCEVHLRRIRHARLMLPEEISSIPAVDSTIESKAAKILNENLLDRYERRALSRRNSAVRKYDLARALIEAARRIESRD
jgi:hypothetical protein